MTAHEADQMTERRIDAYLRLMEEYAARGDTTAARMALEQETAAINKRSRAQVERMEAEQGLHG